MLKRTIAAATAAGLFALAGVTGASAAEATNPVVTKVALTPEQKAAFDAAIAVFHAAQITRQNALSTLHSTIATAMATRNAALAAATTPEARKAAHAAFKAAVESAKATIPVKPVRPVRP
ncbi:MAG: hypothetical protein WCJ89_07830 [Actinomycetes bacterium]